jgi:threonine dehydrogenase-like Zn-dependent dehydrogenase
MHGAVIHGPHDVRYEQRPDPTILEPTDAVVRTVAACVCGSDLWRYRGVSATPRPTPIGHEFVGIVEEVGPDVTSVAPGQFVIGPFLHSDGTCAVCRKGVHSACPAGGGYDGCQAEAVRVPNADGTLVATPEAPEAAMVPSLLALSDVMATGWHAAVCAGVRPGSTVAVVGDGAVGLSGVLAASTMGAERVIAMSRHEARQALAREFGATDIVSARGEEGAEQVRDLTDGIGADAVLECVGTDGSIRQAVDSLRPGGMMGIVGLPHGDYPFAEAFWKNKGVRGGPAPVRAYLPELLSLVWDGTIDPGRVFDVEMPLSEVAEAYAAMDERRAIKVLLRP